MDWERPWTAALISTATGCQTLPPALQELTPLGGVVAPALETLVGEGVVLTLPKQRQVNPVAHGHARSLGQPTD